MTEEIKENKNDSPSLDSDEEEIIDNYEYEQFDLNEKSNSDQAKIDKLNINSNISVIKEEKSPNMGSLTQSNQTNQNDIHPAEEEKADKKPDKTIFSKLAEDMYEKMIQNYKSNGAYFNYDEFIDDRYLAMYSEKINGNNEEMIKSFLERNEQYYLQKVYGEQTKDKRVYQVTGLDCFGKRIITDEDIKNFNDSQQHFIQKRNQKIKDLRQQKEEEITKEIRSKPKVLHKNLSKVLKSRDTTPVMKKRIQPKEKDNKTLPKSKSVNRFKTPNKPPKEKTNKPDTLNGALQNNPTSNKPSNTELAGKNISSLVSGIVSTVNLCPDNNEGDKTPQEDLHPTTAAPSGDADKKKEASANGEKKEEKKDGEKKEEEKKVEEKKDEEKKVEEKKEEEKKEKEKKKEEKKEEKKDEEKKVEEKKVEEKKEEEKKEEDIEPEPQKTPSKICQNNQNENEPKTSVLNSESYLPTNTNFTTKNCITTGSNSVGKQVNVKREMTKSHSKKMMKSNTCSNLGINLSSNVIIANNLLTDIKKQLDNYESNPEISNEDFVKLCYDLYLIIEEKDAGKVNEALGFLSAISEDKITLEIIAYFLMAIYDVLSEEIISKLKLFFPWHSKEVFEGVKKHSKQIKVKFGLFYKNRNDYLNEVKKMHRRMKSESNYRKEKKEKKERRKTPDVHRMKLTESYNLIVQKRENKLKRLRDEQMERMIKECSFTPKITNSHCRRIKDKLYLYWKRREVTHPASNNELDELSNCTFKPSLTFYNENMFYTEPIDEDYNVRSQIRRYQKSRDKKNETCVKFNDKEASDMRFENEFKYRKEGFDKFQKMRKYNERLNTRNKVTLKKKKVDPILTFEIKIRNKPAILNYYYGENVESVVEEFAKKNYLSTESKNQIITAINAKLHNK